jgi:transmembrane sensor
MNSHHQPLDPAADEQAALWAAKLDGSVLSAAERIALDVWLAAAPAHRALLSTYCQFSADLEQQLPLLEGIKDRVAETNRELTTARSHPWLSRPVWVGAMLTAAAAVVALALWPGRVPTQSEELATAPGQRREITLVDGTRLELNAATQLSVAIERHERHVHLARGQAFLAVAKDPSRPFIIDTPAGAVRVTGTQFDVRTTDTTPLEVTVLEGSVQVRPMGSAEPLALKTHDQFAAGAVHTLSDRELADALAWRHGQVVFVGTPLPEVLARFARHHGVVILTDSDLSGLKVGARLNLDDLDGFLATIAENWPELTITRDAQGRVHVARKSDR